MRHARKGPYVRKAVALLLVLVMALALPIMAHATNDVPEKAIHLEVRGFHGATTELFVYGATRQGTMVTDDIEGLSDVARQFSPNIPVLYADVSTTLYFLHPDFATWSSLLLDLEIIALNNSNMTMFCANDCGWYTSLVPGSRPSFDPWDACFYADDAPELNFMSHSQSRVHLCFTTILFHICLPW